MRHTPLSHMNPIPTLIEQAPHTIIDRSSTSWHGERKEPNTEEPIRYCLYARKSEESDERQALSIDSQINTMMAVAKRDDLDIVEVRRESHSAKDSGGFAERTFLFDGTEVDRAFSVIKPLADKGR